MIDQLLSLDPGQRGIAGFFVKGGAAAAAGALLRARRALITTGFVVAEGVAETDGPPGAASLGRALRQLDVAVAYVTDQVSAPVLEAALGAIGEAAPITVFPPSGDETTTARRILAAERPSHLVSIERPGRNATGDYLAARGHSVRQWNTPVDALFLAAPPRLVTVGVGDGGNEIGMGNVRARIGRAGPLLRKTASVVKVTHLVVAGTSNWGAYGIVAELSRRTGMPLLHSADEERKMVQACVDAGAVDGLTRRSEPAVDGLPLESHVGMLELLRLFTRPERTAAATGGRAR